MRRIRNPLTVDAVSWLYSGNALRDRVETRRKAGSHPSNELVSVELTTALNRPRESGLRASTS